MLKFLKDHIQILLIIVVFSVLTVISGIFIVHIHKNSLKKIMYEQRLEKLAQTENSLTNFNALNVNKLIAAERVADILLGKENLFALSDTLYEFKEVRPGENLLTEKIKVQQLYFNSLPVDDTFSSFDDITYAVNVFLSLWLKSENGFVRLISNEPYDEKININFLNDSSTLIKKITSGQRPVRREYIEEDSKLIKSIPVYLNGQVKVFIDLILYESLASFIQRIHTEDNEQLIVFDETGEIHYEKQAAANDFSINASDLRKANISKSRFRTTRSPEGAVLYYTYSPALGFFVAYAIPENSFAETIKRDSLFIWLVIAGIFLFISTMFILFYFKILKAKSKLRDDIHNLITDFKTGTPNEKLDTDLSKMTEELKLYDADIRNYTKALAEGNFQKDFVFVGKKNKTVRSLKKLKERLEIIYENEKKRKKEEELNAHLEKGRNEITELLRYITDMNELSFNILKNTAEFLDIQQGGMFILDNSDPQEPVMEMIASYAYDKKKHASKRIPLDEGLVGRAYLERENIYMTEIPENYTLIESGFGNTEPQSLLIVPLIFNNDVQAVIELASINEIEDYKIKFIESIGESIASTISNLKQTKQSQELLLQTQMQSKEIEEQRKTLEEKINTHRKQNRNLDKEILQLIEIIESIKSITFMIEYDLKGFIMDSSRKTLEVLEAKRGDLISKHHKMLIVDKAYDEKYKDFWTELKENKAQFLTEKLIFGGKEIVLSQSYVPIRNTRRKIYRILSVGSVIE